MPRSNSLSLNSSSLIYTESDQQDFQPAEEDIHEYARRIGIDPIQEPYLLDIAREGLLEKLPRNWKPCLEPYKNAWYYYNTETQVSQWEHPLDAIYRARVNQTKAEHAMNRIQTFNPTTGKRKLPPLQVTTTPQQLRPLSSSRSNPAAAYIPVPKLLPYNPAEPTSPPPPSQHVPEQLKRQETPPIAPGITSRLFGNPLQLQPSQAQLEAPQKQKPPLLPLKALPKTPSETPRSRSADTQASPRPGTGQADERLSTTGLKPFQRLARNPSGLTLSGSGAHFLKYSSSEEDINKENEKVNPPTTKETAKLEWPTEPPPPESNDLTACSSVESTSASARSNGHEKPKHDVASGPDGDIVTINYIAVQPVAQQLPSRVRSSDSLSDLRELREKPPLLPLKALPKTPTETPRSRSADTQASADTKASPRPGTGQADERLSTAGLKPVQRVARTPSGLTLSGSDANFLKYSSSEEDINKENEKVNPPSTKETAKLEWPTEPTPPESNDSAASSSEGNQAAKVDRPTEPTPPESNDSAASLGEGKQAAKVDRPTEPPPPEPNDLTACSSVESTSAASARSNGHEKPKHDVASGPDGDIVTINYIAVQPVAQQLPSRVRSSDSLSDLRKLREIASRYSKEDHQANHFQNGDNDLSVNSSKHVIERAKEFLRAQKHRLAMLTIDSPTATVRTHSHSTMYSAFPGLSRTDNFTTTTKVSKDQCVQTEYMNSDPSPITNDETSGIGTLYASPIRQQQKSHPSSARTSLESFYHAPTYAPTSASAPASTTTTVQRAKITQDIDTILNSLKRLDEQMKYMWSVVGHKHTQRLSSVSSATMFTPLTTLSAPRMDLLHDSRLSSASAPMFTPLTTTRIDLLHNSRLTSASAPMFTTLTAPRMDLFQDSRLDPRLLDTRIGGWMGDGHKTVESSLLDHYTDLKLHMPSELESRYCYL